MNNIKINKVYFDNGVDSDFSQRLELKKLIKDGENKNIVMPSLSMLDRTYDGILELSEKFFSKNDYVFFINELTDLETIYNEINKEKLSQEIVIKEYVSQLTPNVDIYFSKNRPSLASIDKIENFCKKYKIKVDNVYNNTSNSNKLLKEALESNNDLITWDFAMVGSINKNKSIFKLYKKKNKKIYLMNQKCMADELIYDLEEDLYDDELYYQKLKNMKIGKDQKGKKLKPKQIEKGKILKLSDEIYYYIRADIDKKNLDEQLKAFDKQNNLQVIKNNFNVEKLSNTKENINKDIEL